MGAIAALQCPRPRSPVDKHVYDLLATNPHATLRFVRSHNEIDGNEHADMLAKSAMKDALNLSTRGTQISDHGLKRRTAKAVNNPKKSGLQFFEQHAESELHCRILTRIKLRAGMWRNYLHHILPRDYPDSLCESCRVPETLEHFLYHCPQYANARITSGLADRVSDDNSLDFVVQTGRPF